MINYKGSTFAEVYEEILRDVVYEPDHVTKPRGQKINELINVSLEFDPLFPLYENEKRSSQFEYIAGELVWYFNGMKDTNFISKYSKFWNSIKNEDGTSNSAYGNLIFSERENGYTQWNWALESLLNDKDSRQAILHFNKPSHQYKGVKDFVCTLYGIFQIRNNRLNFTVHMRSNDLILGLPTDVAFFCLLQQQMYKHLLKRYPNLKLGMYTHIVNSAHIYERHFKLSKDMLNFRFDEMKFPNLRSDLVKIDGSPTDKMKRLKLDAILGENDESLPYEDSLYDWINDWSTLHHREEV